MILIAERQKKKLGGVTSLFISFPYSKTIIDIIKASGTCAWDDSTHTWECPITSLAFLLDNLTYLDDIKLSVIDAEAPKIVWRPKLEYKLKPRDYQEEGILYGLNHNKWLLLDAPGLGKTLQLTCLAEELKAQKNVSHCLVICGIATLRANWEKEIAKGSNLASVTIGERINKHGNVEWNTVAKRAEQLMSPIKEFFIIINVESLRDKRIIDAIKKGPNKIDMMVFDECHKAKGWSSLQGANLVELSAPYMVASTGTLLMNNPLDAYVPLVWIGKEPKRSVTKFKETYCVFDITTRGRIIGFKNLPLLRDEIESCSLRRTKDILHLPPKNFIDEYVDMDQSQSDFYESIKNSVKTEFSEKAKLECDKIELNTTSLLALVTRLRQASTCPSVLTTDNIHSAKIERAIDLAEQIASNGDKVVIFSTFKEPVKILADTLTDLHPLMGTGDMKDDVVSKNIDLFQNSEYNKVFIGTISKMGTGVTLTKASYMIFIDMPWTEALYTQACDRIYRIGTEKPVFIYNLICRGTIDEMVLSIIKRKGAISDYVIDSVEDQRTLALLKNYISDL
jgi:SWI/SNF-related matrix-associated actin-dependent regulator 1 of chromatin subfamily A